MLAHLEFLEGMRRNILESKTNFLEQLSVKDFNSMDFTRKQLEQLRLDITKKLVLSGEIRPVDIAKITGAPYEEVTEMLKQ